MTPAPPPILILGPTAGGKSELAVALAEQLGGEVIGADSMQVYRHMDAGTAKPPRKLRERVVHHLIDIVEPTERFTVHDWLGHAETVIAQLQAAHPRNQPIVVGGTNLYMKTLLHGLFDGPGQDTDYRQSLEPIASSQLHEQLQHVDPQAASRIAPADRKRIVRALEVFHLTGKPISKLQTQWEDGAGSPTKNITLIGLRWPTEAINRRINLRVKAMFYPRKVDEALAADVCINGESLIDETQRLEAADLLGTQAREALGYKQVLAAIHGQMTMDDAYERTKILTRRFAKQQRTWLRRFTEVTWIEAAEQSPHAIAQQALASLV